MNFENIIIKGKGFGSTYGNIQGKEIDIEYFNESLLNKMYFFTIYEADEDFNKTEKIGQIEMTYMDIWLAESLDYSIFMLFDMIDADKQDVGRYLFDSYQEKNDNYVGMDKDVLYIDKIYIEKKYRNKGLGRKIVQELPRMVRSILKLRPGCLVLLANPFEMEEGELVANRDKEKIEKLIEFYVNNGFERIEDTQYLVKNMDFE